MYGAEEPPIAPNDTNAIQAGHGWAVDLFNYGYYWEAHEVWEGNWHAFGRSGSKADFVKGLIKMSAAGVKAREGNSTGVRRHLSRAKELFCVAKADSTTNWRQEFGMVPAWLISQCDRFPEIDTRDDAACRVMPFVMRVDYMNRRRHG